METTQTTQPAGNAVRTEVKKSAITLDRIYKADFQKPGTLSAQIRQVFITKSFYPNKKTESDMQKNIFATDEFGFGEQEFESIETRIAWIPVPENITEAVVKEKLAAASLAGAIIYKALSNRPILDENQVYAVNNPDLPNATMESFANSQVVRYPAENEKAGQLILDNSGKVQYRRTFFWNEPRVDQDKRSKDPADAFLSPEIAAELKGASVMQGQTI